MPDDPETDDDDQLVRWPFAEAFSSQAESTLKKLVQKGAFPAPRPIGGGRPVAFRLGDLKRWRRAQLKGRVLIYPNAIKRYEKFLAEQSEPIRRVRSEQQQQEAMIYG